MQGVCMFANAVKSDEKSDLRGEERCSPPSSPTRAWDVTSVPVIELEPILPPRR